MASLNYIIWNLIGVDMEMTKINKIKKIVDKWYEERFDSDWDFLQGSLREIYRIVNKK